MVELIVKYSTYTCKATGNHVQSVSGTAKQTSNPIRDVAAQQQVSKGSGDHAGHLLAISMGGNPGTPNLSKQNAVQNTSAYKRHENILKRAMKSGAKVDVDIRSISKPGQDRPLYRAYNSREHHPDGRVVSRGILFANFHTPESRKNIQPRKPGVR